MKISRFNLSFLLLLLLFVFLPVHPVSAEETDLGLSIDVYASDDSSTWGLLDANYSTSHFYDAGTELTITSSEPMTSLYIVWNSLVPEWQLKVNDTLYSGGTNGYLHEYVTLPSAVTSVTIIIPNSETVGDLYGTVSGGMRVSDIYAFSGAVPDWVQQWQPVCEEADILFIPTHADDEHLFFGSILPTYQAEQNKKVQVVYLTQHWVYDSESFIREHEKLNGLWYAGCVYYPIMGDFQDSYSRDIWTAKSKLDSDAATQFIVECIRRIKPLVVVTHDLDGEYGHGQHMLNAECSIEAVSLAGDASYDPESAEKYGTWITPKFYVHLYSENQISLEVNTPLSAFNGLTALEVATNAYLYHESQQQWDFVVSDTEYGIGLYGLYSSTIGMDVLKNDLLENITEENKAQIRRMSSEPFEICSVEDLELLRQNPTASFVLMNDLDLSGIDWNPIDFRGNFDGNGHTIYNLTTSAVSTSTRITVDGNDKEYDTYFSGFFGILENATITNLRLVGVTIDVNIDTNCFIGGIAGYMESSTMEGCYVSGCLSLQADAPMFGVGGLVGFGGNSYIRKTDAELEMVCIDKNEEAKDEQFLGGAYGTGFINLYECQIHLEAYDSDHGYVHDGGLVGMYYWYESNHLEYDYIQNCTVTGFIKFFEDNEDRRAYCSPYVGELLTINCYLEGNENDFEGIEVYEYDTVLLPHSCPSATFTKQVIEPSEACTSRYTLYTCSVCQEYSYKADYELPEHSLTAAAMVSYDPTDTMYGVQYYECTTCGTKVYEKIPAANGNTDPFALSSPEATLPEEETPEESQPETSAESEESSDESSAVEESSSISFTKNDVSEESSSSVSETTEESAATTENENSGISGYTIIIIILIVLIAGCITAIVLIMVFTNPLKKTKK